MKLRSPLLTVALGLTLSAAAWSLQDRGGRGSGDGGEAVQVRLAEQYFAIADRDGNGWISFREAQEALEIDKPRFLVHDQDRDGRVTVEEYTAVCIASWRRYGAFPPPKPAAADPDAVARAQAELNGENEAEAEPGDVGPTVSASSIGELFGRPQPRALREGSRPEPDRIPGPVSSFRRVDHDGDGAISAGDLDRLLFGSGIEMRPAALIATIDTDGDGRISEAEFFASMQDPR